MESIFSTVLRSGPILFPSERPAWSAPVPSADARQGGSHATTNSALFIRVLDALDYGLMLVTDNARLRFANRAALRECASMRCMRLHDGHVRPRQDHEHEPFLKALAASCKGRRSMLTFQSSESALSLAVVPVDEPATASGESATLLVFGRREVCEPLSVDFFAREHRLTPAEGVVLRGLCRGARPGEIARDAGVAVTTVRTQIGSIRLKTGAKSIGDLVRMVTVLPPIVPVLVG